MNQHREQIKEWKKDTKTGSGLQIENKTQPMRKANWNGGGVKAMGEYINRYKQP